MKLTDEQEQYYLALKALVESYDAALQVASDAAMLCPKGHAHEGTLRNQVILVEKQRARIVGFMAQLESGQIEHDPRIRVAPDA